MYKFYQTSTTENKKVDDPESVKKELDSYNTAKMLLPGFLIKRKRLCMNHLKKTLKLIRKIV